MEVDSIVGFFKFKCVIPKVKAIGVSLNMGGQKVETSTDEIHD